MQNFPQGSTPFIMEFNRNIDYRVTFGKPLPKGMNTTQPSLVALAPGVHGLTNDPSSASASGRQVIEKSLKQYTPYTNSDETWKVLEMMIGEHNMSGYEISNQGRIRRRQDQSLVSLFLCNESGQVMCDLGIPSHRRLPVDALVCQVFCMDTLKMQDKSNVVAHHRDGNRLNNHADNLEFMLKDIHFRKLQDSQPHDHTVVLDGRLYHHFGARLSYLVSRDSTRRF